MPSHWPQPSYDAVFAVRAPRDDGLGKGVENQLAPGHGCVDDELRVARVEADTALPGHRGVLRRLCPVQRRTPRR